MKSQNSWISDYLAMKHHTLQQMGIYFWFWGLLLVKIIFARYTHLLLHHIEIVEMEIKKKIVL